MKLHTKLTVLFVLLAIVPLALVSYLSYEDHRQTIEQETINRLVSTTIFKEALVNRWLQRAEWGIRILAERHRIRNNMLILVSHDTADPKYREAKRSICDDNLIPVRKEQRDFLEFFILRAGDGLTLVSTDEKQEEKYRANEPYFVEGKQRTYIQNIYYSLPMEKAVMTISTPIKDKNGRLLAVLAGHVDLIEMSEIMMQSSGLSATEETYVVNKFNLFVTEPRFGEGYALKEAVNTDGVKDCLAPHNNGIDLYNDYRGVPVIGAYRWMPELELCILTEVDQAEAFAPIVVLRKTVLGIGAAVAAIVALLGLFFARTITRPVLQLVKGAEEVGRGNLDYRIEVRAEDEVGRLAGAFNEMTADLGRSQGKLRESEAKYRNLTESLEELIYRADPETFVATYVSRAVEKIYGYTVEEWLGDPTLWENTVHPEDKERIFAVFTEAQRKMESVTIEYRIIRKDKTVRWVEDHAGWEKDRQGNAVSLNGVLYDITERKQAVAAKTATDTIEGMADGLLLATLNGKITFVNPAFERMTGYEHDEPVGRDLVYLMQELVKPEDLEKIMEGIRTVLEGEVLIPIATALVLKDGREIPITVTVSFIRDAEGQPLTVIVAFKDITELKRAEERLREYSKQLEETLAKLRDTQEQLVRREKLAFLGQLAGGVAHELRNPLSVMSNAIYYLRSINTDADETTKEYLEMISSEIGNAEGIVSDLLDFSRTKTLKREEVTASELVAQVLEKQSPPEKVKVTIGIPTELPPVFVDPRQIGQVLGNLVLNAYQAMPEGGNLTISAQAEKEKVSLFITDTGNGISKENREKIFEPLFTTRARGIGLGLAVSKNLAEVNGGSIEAQSEEGKGSTFTVALPIKEAVL